MSGTVFLAGAAGAIGQVLARLLVADGWRVVGTTRHAERARELAALGVEPVVVDAFDGAALSAAVRAARPDAVVHQLTDLPQVLDPATLPQALERNARLREEGTRNLVAACAGTPARRLVVQSIAFAYAPSDRPCDEAHPLNVAAANPVAARTAAAVEVMERLCLASPLEALVLRYGRLYGPRTWFDAPQAGCTVHVDAAADAARRALSRGAAGIYNVAEPGGSVQVDRARRELGWDPGFRAGEPG